jgi:type IV secretory pathway TrbF-like protein
MMKHQRGMTLGGLIFFMVIVGFCAYSAARIVPAYMDEWSIQKVFQAVADNAEIKTMSDNDIRYHLSRSFDTNYIKVIKADDVEIEHISEGVHLSTNYSVKAPFFGNVHLCMDFQVDASSK